MMIRTLVAAALATTLLAPPAAWAGAPTDQLREYTDAIIRILEDPALKGDSRRAERRAAVRRIAAEIFEVNETARRALGIHWQGRTPAERQEFVALFADLLERTYISQIDLFRGERIHFVGEKIDGDAAVVRARVVTRGGLEVPVDARLLRRGDRWLVYDIAVESISLIGNYRSQFDKIIRASSYEDLVQRLRTKQVEFIRSRKGA
jgi:phospholipid transport system substrate-binding protein